MTGGAGFQRKCKNFYLKLSEKIAEKREQHYRVAAAWVRWKIKFSLINSIVLCINENRTVANNNETILRSIPESVETSEFLSGINVYRYLPM